MKKVRIIILFMTLFLGMFFFMRAKVFAADLTPAEWYNHISQFTTFGIAKGEFSYGGSILIVEEPGHVFEGQWIIYYGDADWLEPELSWIEQYVDDTEDFLSVLEEEYEDYDGYLYWNFEENYWQIAYYGTSELDYYEQRVEELEDEISFLEDEISSLEDEISSLEDEISSLEDEISSLEDEISSLENENSSLENEISSLEDEISSLEDEISSLEDEISSLEDEISLLEGLLVENNDIDITKWFVPLVIIIIVVGIIEPIILFKRRG